MSQFLEQPPLMLPSWARAERPRTPTCSHTNHRPVALRLVHAGIEIASPEKGGIAASMPPRVAQCR